MRILIVDDEFTGRKLLMRMLSKYGDCDIAVNGNESIEAFRAAHEENKPYDLVCLDIMMPEMDGQQVLKEIRNIEKSKNILGLSGVKIIMITALDDEQNFVTAFREQCEAYIVKPIHRSRLIDVLQDLKLIN